MKVAYCLVAYIALKMSELYVFELLLIESAQKFLEKINWFRKGIWLFKCPLLKFKI